MKTEPFVRSADYFIVVVVLVFHAAQMGCSLHSPFVRILALLQTLLCEELHAIKRQQSNSHRKTLAQADRVLKFKKRVCVHSTACFCVTERVILCIAIGIEQILLSIVIIVSVLLAKLEN